MCHPQNKQITVLWLEEEPQSLSWETGVTKASGVTLVQCNCVAEAKRLIEERRFDAVICDLILPSTENDRKTGHVRPQVGLDFIAHLRDAARSGATKPDVFLCVISAVHTPETKAQVCRFLQSEKYYVEKPMLDNSDFQFVLNAILKHAEGTA